MKKWKLTHGCIRQDDSITSRDTGYPEYFDTKAEAQQMLQSHSDFYQSIGYKIWFSKIEEVDTESEDE